MSNVIELSDRERTQRPALINEQLAIYVDDRTGLITVDFDASEQAERTSALSKSGKSRTLASTHGPVKVLVGGRIVSINLSAFVSNASYAGAK